jgi:methylmalonyl-CoA/ethylmalonyl-CoA epimerase
MIYDPLQKVNLVLCLSADMPTVEVIFPSEECGPLSAILADRSESLYHLCYRSHDLPTSLAAMKQAGHRVIEVAAPQPAVLFDNKPVSFYLVKGFGLIEIIEG